MDGESRKELERWAVALARSEIVELRAAGRAITTLCAENDELARRLARLEPPRGPGGDDESTPPRASRTQPRPKWSLPWRRAVVVTGMATGGVSAIAVAEFILWDAAVTYTAGRSSHPQRARARPRHARSRIRAPGKVASVI